MPLYKAQLLKREYSDQSRFSENKLEIEQHRDGKTLLKYIDKGSTGIRNNGMTIKYSGGKWFQVDLGEASGLGVLVRAAASIALKGDIYIGSPQVLRDELFTVNQAGLFPLARILRRQLPSLIDANTGGITAVGTGCNLSYSKHTDEVTTIDLERGSDFPEIEDKYGTLGFFVYTHNKDKLSSLSDLFNRTHPIKIKIPHWFFDWKMSLDPSTMLPSTITFYDGASIISSYEYSDIQAQRTEEKK